jgi:hypothetical protein
MHPVLLRSCANVTAVVGMPRRQTAAQCLPSAFVLVVVFLLLAALLTAAASSRRLMLTRRRRYPPPLPPDLLSCPFFLLLRSCLGFMA